MGDRDFEPPSLWRVFVGLAVAGAMLVGAGALFIGFALRVAS